MCLLLVMQCRLPPVGRQRLRQTQLAKSLQRAVVKVSVVPACVGIMSPMTTSIWQAVAPSPPTVVSSVSATSRQLSSSTGRGASPL